MKFLIGWFSTEKGKISFCGMNPDLWSDEEREKFVFYLPQNDPGFHISAETLFCTFSPSRKEKCFQNANLFGLTEALLHTSIADLSGGERKKIFLSVAFSTDEDVFLLLDEPTNSLDKEGIDILISLLSHRRGALLITHNLRIQALPYPTYKVSEKGVTLLDEKDLS